MGMKGFLALISLVLIFFFSSCQKSPDLTESEVYSILNEIIVDDSLHLSPLHSTFEKLEPIGEYSKEFSKADLEFIKRQNKLFSGISIKSGQLKNCYFKHSTTKSRKDIILDKMDTTGIVNEISFPLISEDRQKVLIEIKENCHCMLGGQGGKYLFEKINGHWKLKKAFNFWVS
jgi:hypothetical protein